MQRPWGGGVPRLSECSSRRLGGGWGGVGALGSLGLISAAGFALALASEEALPTEPPSRSTALPASRAQGRVRLFPTPGPG